MAVGWTVEQDNILREYYPIGGGKLCQQKGVDKKLSTIRMRVKALAINNKHKVWSKEELSVLNSLYQTNSLNSLSKHLKGRSCNAIKNKMLELGLEPVLKWSEDELLILREYFPEGGSKLVKQKGVVKSTVAINSKANTLNIRLKESRVSWSDEEVAILKEYYAKEGLSVAKRLNGKKESNIVNKLNTINTVYRDKYKHWSVEDKAKLYNNRDKSIGQLLSLFPNKDVKEVEDFSSYMQWKYIYDISRWTDVELSILLNNYSECSAKELKAKGINKSTTSIYRKLSVLGLIESKTHSNWSDEDINILKECYSNGMLIDKVCDLLPEKTHNAIRCKASSLGLSSSNTSYWSDIEIDILKEHYPIGGANEVMEEMRKEIGDCKRTSASIFKKAAKLGLRRY